MIVNVVETELDCVRVERLEEVLRNLTGLFGVPSEDFRVRCDHEPVNILLASVGQLQDDVRAKIGLLKTQSSGESAHRLQFLGRTLHFLLRLTEMTSSDFEVAS